jgi:hypothetical protein
MCRLATPIFSNLGSPTIDLLLQVETSYFIFFQMDLNISVTITNSLVRRMKV